MTDGERLQRIEDQLNRIASDMESEKDTRKRRNEKIDALIENHTLEIDRLKAGTANYVKLVWLAIGGLVSLILSMIFK